MQSLSNPAAQPVQPTHGHRRQHRKGLATTLTITVEGKTTAEPQAATGMVKAIEILRLPVLSRLGPDWGGQPLVVRGGKPIGRGYHSSGQWWIATHSDSAEKRNVLEEICRRLGLSCFNQAGLPPSAVSDMIGLAAASTAGEKTRFILRVLSLRLVLAELDCDASGGGDVGFVFGLAPPPLPPHDARKSRARSGMFSSIH
jgi:hypothetical protein